MGETHIISVLQLSMSARLTKEVFMPLVVSFCNEEKTELL